MATLLLKAEGVTMMPFQLRRRMAHLPCRGGFAFPSIWEGRWRYTMNISCIYSMYLCMLWEVVISFTLMGGGHPFTLVYTYTMFYFKCRYLKVAAQAIRKLAHEISKSRRARPCARPCARLCARLILRKTLHKNGWALRLIHSEGSLIHSEGPLIRSILKVH